MFFPYLGGNTWLTARDLQLQFVESFVLDIFGCLERHALLRLRLPLFAYLCPFYSVLQLPSVHLRQQACQRSTNEP